MRGASWHRLQAGMMTWQGPRQ